MSTTIKEIAAAMSTTTKEEAMTDINTIPTLDSVISADDVRQKGGGKFAASYVPWGKISQLLREHAPDWQPIAVPDQEGNMAHAAPDGSFYLMMAFRHVDGQTTQPVPHAVMDHKMTAKKNPDARDIADAFVRGMCKAAALSFGLGIEMWTGDPLDDEEAPPKQERTYGATDHAKRVESQPQPWDSREHAEEALKNCLSKDQLQRWTDKTRASQFIGLDRDELLTSYNEHLETLNEVQ